jgi:exopolysaccharide biosynthesis polyprenyl glycosylphosphotransferase
MKRSELFFAVLLVPLDFLALLAAFVYAYYLRDTSALPQVDLGSLAIRLKYEPSGAIVLGLDRYLHYVVIIIPAMLVIFGLVGLYAIRGNASFSRRLARVVVGVSGGEFFVLLLFLLKKDFFLPRSTVLFSWILGIVFVVLGRSAVRLVQRLLYRKGIGTIRVGVIGRNQAAERLVDVLGKDLTSSYRVVFQLPDAQMESVLEQIKESDLDELIVASGQCSDEDLAALRNRCLEQHVGFSFVPSLLTELQSSFEVRDIEGLPIIEVRPTPLEGWHRVVKRLFDYVVSILIICLLSPVYLIIALAIMATDPGPLIFRHKCIGKNHRPVFVSKFRSMRVDWGNQGGGLSANFLQYLKDHPEAAREWNEGMKLKEDPRISKIGKILRRTRLDELPQFFDVLAGSLSVIGPRPIIESEVERFGEKARILFTVRPGITGLWQVRGGNHLSYGERVVLNSYYIEHWSLWLDIVILFQTAWLVLTEIGAKLLGMDRPSSGY